MDVKISVGSHLDREMKKSGGDLANLEWWGEDRKTTNRYINIYIFSCDRWMKTHIENGKNDSFIYPLKTPTLSIKLCGIGKCLQNVHRNVMLGKQGKQIWANLS